MDDEEVEQVKSLIEKIMPLLERQPRHISGTVLGNLLGMWVAGHIVDPFDPEVQNQLDAKLLRDTTQCARDFAVPYRELLRRVLHEKITACDRRMH